MQLPQDWCIANRQWKRVDNIKHASMQLANATDEAGRNFWKEVLECFNNHKR